MFTGLRIWFITRSGFTSTPLEALKDQVVEAGDRGGLADELDVAAVRVLRHHVAHDLQVHAAQHDVRVGAAQLLDQPLADPRLALVDGLADLLGEVDQGVRQLVGLELNDRAGQRGGVAGHRRPPFFFARFASRAPTTTSSWRSFARSSRCDSSRRRIRFQSLAISLSM